MKPLINGQTLRIDDHIRGTGQATNWDDPSKDIHMEKITDFPWNGEKGKSIIIKIPLNSDLPIRIDIKGVKRNKIPVEIPPILRKEIESAFEDKNKRAAFVNDLKDVLKGFPTKFDNVERCREVLEKIGTHFNIDFKKEVMTIVGGKTLLYTIIFQSKEESIKHYYITLGRNHLVIGNLQKWNRWHGLNLKGIMS
jgi:hypothetical protein